MESNGLCRCDSRRSETSLEETSGNPWYQVILGCSMEHPEVCAQGLRACIKAKAEQEDHRAAIALLNQLIIRHPNSAIDYNNRGLMYCKQGDCFRAIEDFEQAIVLNPHLDQAYNNRGNCQAKFGNLVKALEDYETAIDLNPYNQKAWINKGITLRELGWYDLALETFDFALIVQQTFQGRIYGERGYTYHWRGDWNCAIADYRRALLDLSQGDQYKLKVQQWLSQLLRF